jgi:RNA polymerase sigma factor (sigma-70 family)
MTEPANSLPTRHSLLGRIKDLGDDASWRDFFDTYWELIYNLARKSGLTDAESQDVVQEVVIAVSRNIADFRTGREHGSFKAWLLQQTRWRIADQFVKRDKFARSPEPDPGGHSRTSSADDQTRTSTVNQVPDPAATEPEAAWDKEWEKHILAVASERIKMQVSAKQFQMFDLHAMQGLSARDTARTVGTSVAAVYVAATRLRRLLRREVARLERAKKIA